MEAAVRNDMFNSVFSKLNREELAHYEWLDFNAEIDTDSSLDILLFQREMINKYLFSLN